MITFHSTLLLLYTIDYFPVRFISFLFSVFKSALNTKSLTIMIISQSIQIEKQSIVRVNKGERERQHAPGGHLSLTEKSAAELLNNRSMEAPEMLPPCSEGVRKKRS